eukprot:scaffold211119_cov30-Tisochrysis_lutea.AAC.1
MKRPRPADGNKESPTWCTETAARREGVSEGRGKKGGREGAREERGEGAQEERERREGCQRGWVGLGRMW